jgi:hypothetical protein
MLPLNKHRGSESRVRSHIGIDSFTGQFKFGHAEGPCGIERGGSYPFGSKKQYILLQAIVNNLEPICIPCLATKYSGNISGEVVPHE